MSPFKPYLRSLTAAAALVIIGAVVFLYVKNTGAPAADATQEAVTTPTDTATATPAGTSSNTSPYKDGTYTAQSTYRTPETTEPLTVTLTLQNGIVTDANVVGDPQAPETVRYQGDVHRQLQASRHRQEYRLAFSHARVGLIAHIKRLQRPR